MRPAVRPATVRACGGDPRGPGSDKLDGTLIVDAELDTQKDAGVVQHHAVLIRRMRWWDSKVNEPDHLVAIRHRPDHLEHLPGVIFARKFVDHLGKVVRRAEVVLLDDFPGVPPGCFFP